MSSFTARVYQANVKHMATNLTNLIDTLRNPDQGRHGIKSNRNQGKIDTIQNSYVTLQVFLLNKYLLELFEETPLDLPFKMAPDDLHVVFTLSPNWWTIIAYIHTPPNHKFDQRWLGKYNIYIVYF
jgi:hypothetical protein